MLPLDFNRQSFRQGIQDGPFEAVPSPQIRNLLKWSKSPAQCLFDRYGNIGFDYEPASTRGDGDSRRALRKQQSDGAHEVVDEAEECRRANIHPRAFANRLDGRKFIGWSLSEVVHQVGDM